MTAAAAAAAAAAQDAIIHWAICRRCTVMFAKIARNCSIEFVTIGSFSIRSLFARRKVFASIFSGMLCSVAGFLSQSSPCACQSQKWIKILCDGMIILKVSEYCIFSTWNEILNAFPLSKTNILSIYLGIYHVWNNYSNDSIFLVGFQQILQTKLDGIWLIFNPL